MSDESAAPVAEEAVSYSLPSDAPEAMSVSEAARLLSQARRKSAEPAESAEPATAQEPELAEQADSDPEEAPAEIETQADEPEEKLPPIEPPRSWTKEEKEAFKAWPREAQESIARVTSTREADFRRSQNEAADARKALQAQMAQAEEVRKQYEAKLPQLTTAIETAIQQEFGDIQTIHDLRKMQAEDPFRYQQWDLRQKELAMARQEQQEAEQRQKLEKQTNWANYVQAESKAFEDDMPDFKDKKDEYTKKAATVLSDLGFTNEELSKLASGDDKIALYDRRLQRLLFDRIRLDEIKAAPAKAVPPKLPPVSRPGVARSGNASSAIQIQNLETQLSKATGNQAIRLAAELTRLKRTAAG